MSSVKISTSDRGIEVSAADYRLLLDRTSGYAGREVEIRGTGRLDRFDRPGEGPHPTCMNFDNVTVNNTFQLGHYGKVNDAVKAELSADGVRLCGHLIPIVPGVRGRVRIDKSMRFEDDLYEVSLKLAFEDVGPIDFASVWWDVNDKWLRSMRSSAGVLMPLNVGTGECFGDTLIRSWRSMNAMDRGAGVWMEMRGDQASVMAALGAPGPAAFPAGGMKFWDGPDDADEGEGVSHGCVNLDLINSSMSGHNPLPIGELAVTYRVFLSGPTRLRT